MAQIQAGRHFIAEHPQSSDLWQLPIWREIAQHCSVARVLVHQCMAGLKGRRSGIPVMKPTEFWASDPLLVQYLHGLRCDGRHQHAALDCPKGAPGDKVKDAARWPPRLCHLIAKGCEDLLRREKKKDKRSMSGALAPARSQTAVRFATDLPANNE